MEYVDAHSHLHDRRFDADREEVLERMQKLGIATITVGTDLSESRRAVELAASSNLVFATVGQHPVDRPEEIFDPENYRELLKHPKVVALGECGLDYFRIFGDFESEKKRQRDIFERQIELSVEVEKPLMIHCRNAHEDTLFVLESKKREYGGKLRGNIHFFTGTQEIARRYFDLGFTVSFTAVITFASEYDEVIRYAPLNCILVETDSPYVAPAQFRGKRNEPSYVTEVVKRIAEIRSEAVESVRRATVQNALKVFNVR